ncbi:hypothetical protein CEXT_604461 [Caerostris extrusa]|uniref:Uncharacterized protein n=1 Tax=Caerostris extrusa TaxID=172846 RepID=A0AAV4RIN1_CAEEX|nr:hypothetical protein CEXT_604461 [Caerostris extrusa]
MPSSPRRWNRTTQVLISYGFEARTPDHWRSSGGHYMLVVCTYLRNTCFFAGIISRKKEQAGYVRDTIVIFKKVRHPFVAAIFPVRWIDRGEPMA